VSSLEALVVKHCQPKLYDVAVKTAGSKQPAVNIRELCYGIGYPLDAEVRQRTAPDWGGSYLRCPTVF